ncbi:MAG: PhoH family protein [Elusimicrobiota bacterium]
MGSVTTGDIRQSDIQKKNGLMDAISKLKNIGDIAIVKLTQFSVVRNPIIVKIEEVYSV